MRLLLNLIWLITGGIWLSLSYFLLGKQIVDSHAVPPGSQPLLSV